MVVQEVTSRGETEAGQCPSPPPICGEWGPVERYGGVLDPCLEELHFGLGE